MTKSASRSIDTTCDAVSSAPFASRAFAGAEVTIAGSLVQCRSVGSKAWVANCRILEFFSGGTGTRAAVEWAAGKAPEV